MIEYSCEECGREIRKEMILWECEECKDIFCNGCIEEHERRGGGGVKYYSVKEFERSAIINRLIK